MPLVLPKLFINNQVIKRQWSIKFLRILLDENLSWKEHLKLTENKFVKNVWLIYKAKPYLNKDLILALYFSYIHSYINYAYLVWESANRTYLWKINSQQKHALRLIHNKNRFYHSKELFESCEIFNLYKLNLLNTAVFMYKIKNKTAPSSFLEKFEQPAHSYPTRFSSGNYRKPQIILRRCRFPISIKGPAIWNNLVGSTEKENQSSSLFKTKIKSVGFLRVPPLRLVEQIVWFFSLWLVCYLVHFFQYIFVYGFVYYSLIVKIGVFIARAL